MVKEGKVMLEVWYVIPGKPGDYDSDGGWKIDSVAAVEGAAVSCEGAGAVP
jgi:hypothetical protein